MQSLATLRGGAVPLADQLKKIAERTKASHQAEDAKNRQALLDEWGLSETETSLKRVVDEIRFRRAVAQIPSRAKLAAELGDREMSVYHFREDEIDRSQLVRIDTHNDVLCTSDMLIGVAERVYKHCVAERLSPRIHWKEDVLNRVGHWCIVISF